MKKKRRGIIIIIIGLIVIIPCLYITGNIIYNKIHYSDKTVAYEESWEIDLPEYIEVYETKTPLAWFNEGIKYTVFELEEVPTNFLDNFVEDTDLEYQNEFQMIWTSHNEQISIKSDYVPQWEEEYLCQKLTCSQESDRLYLFYFSDSKKLIICQSIT